MFFAKNGVLHLLKQGGFMENSYYKKIIYKKNAIDDLKTFIKINYAHKRVLCVLDDNVLPEEHSVVLNALCKGADNVGHFCAKENFCRRELDLLSKKIVSGKYDVLVSVGGEMACESCKFFAWRYNLAFVVCPTKASSFMYFLNFCINPYDANKSFYANSPDGVFISEDFIKQSNLFTNINGLCFLNSLRAVLAETAIVGEEEYDFFVAGLKKLFIKLDEESVNILLCSEDANLTLMDLLIDFGFFAQNVNLDCFYLFKMFMLCRSLNGEKECFGKELLVCSKMILGVFAECLRLGFDKKIEMPNYSLLEKMLKKTKINSKNVKNAQYFNGLGLNFAKFNKKVKKDENINLVVDCLYEIKRFCASVKNVYKGGIEVGGELSNFLNGLALSPYISGGGELLDVLAGCGVLNSFLTAS